MSLKITLHPSGHAFDMEADETILDAALREGLHLPYGCRNGACGACKATVVEGMVDHGAAQEHALPLADRDRGITLLCCAKPLTDVTVEVGEIQAEKDVSPRLLPCRVESLERVSEDVAVLRVKLPDSERLMFLPGQYVDILMPDGKKRSFSIANAPHDDGFLEFHIRHVPGGTFTDHVFRDMKLKEILRFEGPHGSFFLREESDKPILMVASGTGFAPVKAIVEHALYMGVPRPITLYWGARCLKDLYLLELARSWGELEGFTFVPVLSEPLAEDSWSGRTGLVHEAVLADFTDLSTYQAYVCGAPAMVEAAHKAFTSERGLPSEEFLSDAFFTATGQPVG